MRSEQAGDHFDHAVEAEKFEQFVRDTYSQLYRYARRLCGDHDLAEDLVQETYLHLWRAWPDKQQVIVEVASYRFRVLVNSAKSYWRVKRNWRLASESEIKSETEFIAEEHALIQRMAIRDALEGLPDPIRTIITLNVIGATPMAVVAKSLELAEGTCRNYKTAGMKMLRSSLAKMEIN
uniref:RNA polymerase sigma factor n=1 Tax=Amycolatopsis sp. CA-082387 TaxID=3239918 RepID=UPI003F49668D